VHATPTGWPAQRQNLLLLTRKIIRVPGFEYPALQHTGLRSISGTASSERTFSIALMYRESVSVSATRNRMPRCRRRAGNLNPLSREIRRFFRQLAAISDGEPILEV